MSVRPAERSTRPADGQFDQVMRGSGALVFPAGGLRERARSLCRSDEFLLKLGLLGANKLHACQNLVVVFCRVAAFEDCLPGAFLDSPFAGLAFR